MGHQAAQVGSQSVPHPPGPAPPLAPRRTSTWVRSSAHSDASAISLSRQHRGTRRCIHLLVMMELHDLRCLNQGAATRRNASSAPRRSRSWGPPGTPDLPRRGEGGGDEPLNDPSLPTPVVPTTVWIPWVPHQTALSDRRLGDREVHRHLDAGIGRAPPDRARREPCLGRVPVMGRPRPAPATSTAATSSEIRAPLHGRAHRGAHTPRSTDHSHLHGARQYLPDLLRSWQMSFESWQISFEAGRSPSKLAHSAKLSISCEAGRTDRRKLRSGFQTATFVRDRFVSIEGDRPESLVDLFEGQHTTMDQLAVTDATHPGPGVLEAEGQ